MGIIEKLRARTREAPNEPNVIVTDDEFEELLTALYGMGSRVVQDDGTGGRPIVVFGRRVVAPDGSQRESRGSR